VNIVNVLYVVKVVTLPMPGIYGRSPVSCGHVFT